MSCLGDQERCHGEAEVKVEPASIPSVQRRGGQFQAKRMNQHRAREKKWLSMIGL